MLRRVSHLFTIFAWVGWAWTAVVAVALLLAAWRGRRRGPTP